MFALWCERLPAHQLEEVRRFTDDWQAKVSLALRRGDPTAAVPCVDHHRLQTVHPALVADRVARQFERLAAPRRKRGHHHRLGGHGPGHQRRDPAPA
jgi:hypothetical protein